LFQVIEVNYGALSVVGALVACHGALAAQPLKKIIVYSSLLALSWIILAHNSFLALEYLLSYTVSLGALTSLFVLGRNEGLVEREYSGNSLFSVAAFGAALFSLGGVPPLIGFYFKINILF